MLRFRLKIKVIIVLSVFISFYYSVLVEAKTFKVASYNVENFFDLCKDGTEYIEYIPNTKYGWNKDILEIKGANIAKVIKSLEADVIALQEIESKKALIFLQDKLRRIGVDYSYIGIADSKATAVKCAVMSKFPIINKEEIRVGHRSERNILKVTLDIDGNSFILFINHWKSKQGPESRRITYAKKIRKEIDQLKKTVDFIVIGDFNSNYNEYKTFKYSSRLNNTGGITGINQIIRTVKDSVMVDEKILTGQFSKEYLYNLWLEFTKSRRWSYKFYGYKNSPDSIIVSSGLYDDKGISYVDNSFDKFDPDYLFKGQDIYRWQMDESDGGKHLGKGYSDHLPVFAYFSTKPLHFKNNAAFCNHIVTSHLIDLNSAAPKELQTIKGIGPVLSARIIAGRPYKTVDDLLKVKGIGVKTLEKICPYFVVKH
ncbi:MAG: endonuclease [Candidatus Omnitrophota bacterium]|nr:MAG: endonuclease [Candidatus Omnitrophota bacterium]